MANALDVLERRNSAAQLAEPAPDAAARARMFAAALRAPDHAWLQPRRFIVIEGEARARLGEAFLAALLEQDAAADAAAQAKARHAPLRAPLLVAVICRCSAHPKVPDWEQRLSAGCAAYAMLLSAEAQGYAGIWRTGMYARAPAVARALALAENEEIVAFLYLGTRAGQAKPLPERRVEDFVSDWRA